jgi:hypothetical protein
VKALLLTFMGGTLSMLGGSVSAGPWSFEPRIGVSTTYDTNPGLRELDPVSETHVAALFNLPLRYDADGVEFSLTPNGSISNSSGYSSLASNSLHLDANAQFSNDLGSTVLQGGLARDSSLYHAGGYVNGVGVRRDTGDIGGDWNRYLTERSQIQLDLSWSRVRYDQPPNATILVDYRYFSAGPTFVYALSERTSLKVLGSFGDYESLDGITGSKSENAQLALVRQMSELWSLTASAGYSHSSNSEKFFFGPYLLGSVTSDQNGAVYSANVSRQSEKLNLSGGVSRTFAPTGFAYLSRQDGVNLNATYARSERWDFSVAAVWQIVRNPTLTGADSEAHFLNARLTANWHWTPQWIISMHVGRITQQYGPPPVSVGSGSVGVDFIRQFLRTEL